VQFDTIHAYINGSYLKPTGGETFTNFFPGNNDPLGEVDVCLDEQVNLAVAAAKQAQRLWAKKTGVERGRVLLKAASILRERNQELATLEVWDTGKPICEAATVDVLSGADALEYFGSVAAGLKGDSYQLGDNFAYTIREPLGVVAGIGAWNYPLQIACWKAAPALAAGNGMVFKPSELTPMTAPILAEILMQAGAPAGLFNVVQGDHRTGELLTHHPEIAKVSLTGEVGTGRKVMAAAAKTLKHVTFELGGKSPLIIFADADLDNAVKGAILANFYTQGEVCTNGTRVFVHQDIESVFLEKLAEATAKLVVGDPHVPETTVGSLISPEHCDRVLEYIKVGLDEGAELFCGGKRHGSVGNFVEPTILVNCHDQMTVVKEEIFGPVMSVLNFEREGEVISRANDTEFGLAAGVFTRDLAKAHRCVAQIEAGICWINTYNITPIEIPFGGVKQSGVGRENSLHALDHYTQLKTIYVETGNLP
jgi:betaine-aldehyde dehydrogenase